MRILFFLLALAGLVLGIVYPAAVDYFSGELIANLPVYDRARGFAPVTVPLNADDAPVRVMLSAATLDNFSPPNASAHLTITATHGSRTVLASPVVFVAQQARESASNSQRLSATVGLIDPVDAGDYRFDVNFGDAGTLPFQSVELVLRRRALVADERAQPIGYMLLAVGVVGFVLSLTRGGGSGSSGGGGGSRGPQWGREAAPPG